MPRKPLIEAGSILPAQDPESGGDVMSRIIARDREKRGVLDDTGTQEHRNTDTQVPANRSQGLPPEVIQAPVNPGIQAPVPEPIDKATFDLPRSLHQQLKMRAVVERRPARAILIDLLTRYLQEEVS